MINKKIIDAFWNRRQNMKDPTVAARLRHSDAVKYDKALIEKYITKNSKILDLGAGSCILSNILIKSVNSIVAVEKQKGLLNYGDNVKNLTKINTDIMNFTWHKKEFDCVLLFGVANYLTDEDLKILYERISRDWLKDEGFFIAKHQSGQNEDVVINTFSEEIDDHYSAVYRHYKNDRALLAEYFSTVAKIDIYPDELNKWKNTRNYAYLCR